MELQLLIELLFTLGPLRKRMPAHGALLFRSAENDRDCAGYSLPVLHFAFEVLPALVRERIELRLPAGVRGLPFRGEQFVLLQLVKGGIERALLELEDVVGNLLNAH